MRILILGNDYVSENYLELFSKNKDNIVFSTIKNSSSFISFQTIDDIKDFCQANEINFVLIIDEEYINMGLNELLSSCEITVFSPSCEAISICDSKSTAKKFMYKNQIQTPRFQIAEKPQIALDYIKSTKTIQVIKPEIHSYQECPLFCETYKNAKKIVDSFFQSGNKRILIEDYIEGKNFSVWAISDGYSAKIIATCAKYQNNIAYFEPDFIDENIKNEIQNKFINPTIQGLSNIDSEYIGILGFDFILTYDNQLFLLGYNSFFDDISVNFFTQGYDIDWIKVFESVIVGDVFLKYDFSPEYLFMVCLRQNEKIKLIKANTKINLKRYLKELDYDIKEYNEALKIWKY